MMTTPDFDAVVIGAGLSGLYMAYRLREQGWSVKGIEGSDDLGGVWHQNRYPGARVDSESEVYAYLWNRDLMNEFTWTERFASQPEVLKYLHRAADYMDVRKDFIFNTRVRRMDWDETAGIWTIRFDDAGIAPMTARFVFSALGPLSAPQMPKVPGIHTFAGQSIHTAKWPRDPNGFGPANLDLAGKRIAVIGTGSSGVQIVQEMGKIAGELFVMQRSPGWCTPLGNGPMTPERMTWIRENYDHVAQLADNAAAGFPHYPIPHNLFDVPKEERDKKLEELYQGPGFSLWLGAYQDIGLDEAANRYVSDFVAEKIRERVNDPETAEKLIPRDHGFGTKRVALETGYYETYNRPNVHLVDLKATPIERILPTGIRTSDRDYEVDVIIYATGFDAIKGAWNRIDIRGVEGKSLKSEWDSGVRTFLGMQNEGFPNLFYLVGPQNGATFCNIARCSAMAVEWMTGLMAHIRDEDITRIEPRRAAVDDWVGYCEKMLGKVLLGRTDSWFTGVNKNIEGRTQREVLVFAGGNPKFREYCNAVAERGYSDFAVEYQQDRVSA